MMQKFFSWSARATAFLACLLPCASMQSAFAQTRPTTYAMTLNDATEYKDAKGRVIIVGHVTGALQGVLTLALNLSSSGNVASGEWALNVSFTQFGPPDKDGDGDASEVLVQRGVIKGLVTSGGAQVGANGLAVSASGLQLQVNGATVQFATVTSGSGSFTGVGLLSAGSANGTLNLTF